MVVQRLKGGEEALYEDQDVLSRMVVGRASFHNGTVGLVITQGTSLNVLQQCLQDAMQEATSRLTRVPTAR